MPRKKKQPEPEIVQPDAIKAPERPQLHVSGISMMMKCPVQFEFRYIKKMKSPPGVALLIGKATDKAVTDNLDRKIKTGELMTREEVTDLAADYAVKEWFNEAPKLTPDEAKSGVERVRGKVVDTSVKMSVLHHAKLAPIILPKFVQRELTIELDGYDIDLAGTIDIDETTGVVRDTKTAAKPWDQDQADQSLQMTAYGWLKQVHDGEFPQKFIFDVLLKPIQKAPNGRFQVIPTGRGPADYDRLYRIIERAVMMMEKGAFTPTDPASWWCSPLHCGFWDKCDFVQKAPVSVPVQISLPINNQEG